MLNALLDAGLVPVISPLAATDQGELLNVNADTVAATIAVAISAQTLCLVSSADGIRSNIDDPDSVVPDVNLAGLATLRQRGALQGGMLPKVAATETALLGGVRQVQIGQTTVRAA